MTSKKQAFPGSIGESIDLLYQLREERLALQRQIDERKEQESALSAHIQQKFDRADIDGAKGKLATASIKTSTQADLKDWNQLIAYVVREKEYQLLQRRVNVSAARELWDAKRRIPGVEPLVVTALSVTRR